MATMNRNLNLEEVNSDALMGISYLNYQTVSQKVIFFGSIIVGIALNLLGNFLFHIGTGASICITLIPLIVGIAFGCNYNQDLSLIKYVKLLLFKPSVTYYSKPTEDIEQIKNSASRIKKEELLKERQQQQASPEEQKKLLIKLLIGVIAFIIFMIVILMVISGSRTQEIHHTVMTGAIGAALV